MTALDYSVIWGRGIQLSRRKSNRAGVRWQVSGARGEVPHGGVNPPLHTLAKSEIQNRGGGDGRARAGRGGSQARLPKGNLSDTRGAEIGRKWVIFGGFGREKGGQKGVFAAPKAGKRRFFACRRGDWRAQRVFGVKIGHYVSASARPKSTPGTMRRVRQMRVRTYESLANPGSRRSSSREPPGSVSFSPG